MAILSVGPNSLYLTIADAMLAASASDTIQLESGYGNETATVTHDGMIVTGEASSTGVVLDLAIGIATLTLAGAAPINVIDGPDANTIVGNNGDNVITVSSGVDVVNAGAGTDRLIIDYSAAVAAITGTPVNVTDGGIHAVTFTGVENFTISTGSAADTITVGDGVNVLNTGAGNDTITAGNGANTINGGPGNDTIVAGDGGNTINGGDGNDGITTGTGNDIVIAGLGNDTVITGGGADVTMVNGGIDTVDSGSGSDRLTVDYSSSITAVNGGVTGGTLAGGYDGNFADVAGTSSVVFHNTENFTVTTGSGNDVIATGDGNDVLDGGAGTDQLNGGGGNDTLLIGLGNDALDGGDGTDTAVFSITRANYQVNDLGGGVLQTIDLRAGSPDGTDTLVNMESFAFTDGTFDAITVLITVPTTTVSTLAFSADTGVSNSDFITSTAAQTISGTLSANLVSGERVEVSLDNGATWTTAVAAVGASTFSLAGQTLAGSNVLEARVANSTSSGTATTQPYVLDTTAPGQPSTPVLTSGSDSGVQGDGITSVTTLTVTGAAEAGSTVKLYDTDGTTVLGTSVTTGDDTYSITSSTLSGGSHTLRVSATDAAGNVGLISSGIAATIDTTAPIAPTLTLAHDTGSSITDGITNDPTITVAAESGATLLYKVDGATSFSAAAPVFAIDGSSDGSHTVLVEQQDAAGNIGPAANLTFTLDTTAPVAPTLTLAHDTGFSSTDGITSDPTITVAAESGATLLYKVDGAASFSTTAPVFAIDGSADGSHMVLVEQQDAAGNIGAASSLSLTLDTTAPGAPTLTLAHDTGSSITDGITNDPTITVAAESGATLLYKVDGAASFSAAAPVFAIDGSSDGSHTVLVEQQDAAGNIGAAANLSFTLDTTAPVAPALALAHDTGSSSVDGITGDPTITVTAESGATLLYKVDGAASFSTTAPVFAVDGSNDGSHTVLVEQQDAAGNIGAASSLSLTLDTTAPGAPTLTLAHDTGSSITDGITSDPTITVAAESGATLLYKVDGAASFSTTAPVFAIDGSADGSHMVLVEQQDAAGNTGAASGLSFTLDTITPAAPTLALAHDTGSSSTDGITRDPTIKVTAESDATLLYKVDGAASFSTTAPVFAVDGSNDGSHTVLVEQQDAAGNIGAATSLIFSLDTTAPTALTLALAHDTGSSSTDGITSDPTIDVTAESGATLLYKVDGAVSFSTTAPAFAVDGSNDGSHTVLVEQQDAAGNTGAASSVSFTLDTTAPGAPTLALANDTGSSAADGIACDPTINVIAANGATLLYKVDGATSFSATAPVFAVDGSADGQHVVSVEQQDAAGNTGAAANLTFTLDTTAPIAPTLTLAHDTGFSSTDGITSDPTITIAAESGATLFYKAAGAASFSTTTPDFTTDGMHTVAVKQQDVAGNIGAASGLTFTLDTITPGAPTLALAHDTGSLSTDGITRDPTINVTAESHATLLYKVDGAVSFSTTAPVFAVDGSADGQHVVSVEQQDAAGNIGAAANLTFTLDTTAPVAPTLTLAHDTGSSITDGITSDPTIHVTAESGATLLYKVDGAASFSTTAPDFTTDGLHTVAVEQQDVAGNTGAAASLTFTLDTTAPGAPTLTLAHDTGSSITDAITSDPTITVGAESGVTLLYKVDSAASFSTTAPDFTTDGVHTVAVEQQDVAGNTGGAANLTFTLDTTAPAAPTLGLAHDTGASGTDNITNDPTIVYTSAENGGVFLYKADDAANFSFAAASFATNGSVDGGHTVSVEQQDVAGNIGAASGLNFTLDTTAPHVTGLSASLANGTGETTIDFTLTFNEAVKVIGGTPALALNNGNSAAYDAAVTSALGDSSKLVFDHLVAAGNTPVSFVEVAAFVPHGSVVVDIAGNTADVSHVAASFGHLSDDTFSPPHMPFAFDL